MDYEIQKAAPVALPPEGVTAAYGQTLSKIELINPLSNTLGTWAWVDETESVGSIGEHFFQANFTPADTSYNVRNNVDVKVTVEKGPNPAVVWRSASVETGGKELDLSKYVQMNDAQGAVHFAISGDAHGCSLNGSVLTYGAQEDAEVTVNVTVDEDANYYALPETSIRVKIKGKPGQVILGSEVTTTYGVKDVSVSAYVYYPSTGGGAISYAVGPGSRSYIDVDAATGALTIKRVGKATVIATAAETDEYRMSTAELTVTINKADPVAIAPTELTAVYGQALSEIDLPNPEGNTPGTWAWADDTQSVGEAGSTHYFKATFTPDDTTNYNVASDIKVGVEVEKAPNPATVASSASVQVGGHTVDLSECITRNDAMGQITYEFVNIDDTKDCALNGSVLTTGDQIGAVAIRVTIAADNNYEALADREILVNVQSKQKQTVTADDVTVTYGEAGKRVSATTDGDGEISYAVLSDADVIDVDASTGALTTMKAGEAIVGVTAAETDAYMQATGEVTVTVNKAEPIAKAPAGLTAAYGQTLSEIELTNPEGNTPGTWAWADGSAGVGEIGYNTFKAVFTPEDTANYNTVSGIDVHVAVGKAKNPATVVYYVFVENNGGVVDLADYVMPNGATGAVTFAFADESDTKDCTLENGILRSANKMGTVPVDVSIAADSHYEALKGRMLVGISGSGKQTIEADDVTTVYGALDAKVSAKVTDPATGGGAISYAVWSGADVVDVDASTGALTTRKAGEAIIGVTAAETATYMPATRAVKVTVNKAVNPASVAAEATVMRGGNTVDLSKNVTLDGATGTVSYRISGEDGGCTLNGSVLTSGDGAGSVKVDVTVGADDRYAQSETKTIAVTITEKKTQTITAGDVIFAYGAADAKIHAATNGDGAISFAVRSGKDVVDVNATTGALTIRKAGEATVVVTAAETKTYAQATAKVAVTVRKAEPTIKAVPAGLKAIYGQTLSEITLTNPGGNTPGTWAWANGSAGVGEVGERTFKAVFTPQETEKYNVVSDIDVQVTVGQADNPATVVDYVFVKNNGGTVNLAEYVLPNGATGAVTYEFADDKNKKGCTLDGSVLTLGEKTGNVPVNVSIAEDKHYKALTGRMLVCISGLEKQTITAEDVTTVYGASDTKVSATTSGDGAISYAVWSGADVIDVDASTGALTTKKAGEAIVGVTAAEKDTYMQETKAVKVTVSKAANSVGVAVEASVIRDGNKVDLSDYVTLNGATGTVSYDISGDACGCTLNGSVLTSGDSMGIVSVNVTVGEDDKYEASGTKTIAVTIDDKKTQTVTADAVTITYGDTGRSVSAATDGDGAISYAVKKGSADTIAVEAYTGVLTTRKAGEAIVVVTATETKTCAQATTEVLVTVNKAANPASVAAEATVTRGENKVDLSDCVTLNGATGTVLYEISGEAYGCTLDGSVLTSGDSTGSVNVNVTVGEDDKYEPSGTKTIVVTIADKKTQTITARDVTVAYGATDARVRAATNGDGAISYAVREGSADTIDVDASTGALTIKKAGAATVVVTAAETAIYAQATREVSVTIYTRAMTVNAEGYTGYFDEAAHGITVTVIEPASGFTVKYGTEEGSYNLTESPTQTEVGSLTVYYQVTAENYTTATGSATVTINNKETQTITASDVKTIYGATDAKVSATTDGGGAISYAVREGSADTIDVDASTGALTIKKAVTATVIVTAAETDTYAQATKDVTVTIDRRMLSRPPLPRTTAPMTARRSRW